MKNTILILLISLMCSGLYAQKEDKESFKIAYITNQLELTESEAKSFWPVYNAMCDELKQARKEFRENRPKGRLEDLSDEEVEKLLDETLKFKRKDIEIKEKYHKKFKAVLPIKKIAKLYVIERNFKKYMKGHKPPPSHKDE